MWRSASAARSAGQPQRLGAGALPVGDQVHRRRAAAGGRCDASGGLPVARSMPWCTAVKCVGHPRTRDGGSGADRPATTVPLPWRDSSVPSARQLVEGGGHGGCGTPPATVASARSAGQAGARGEQARARQTERSVTGQPVASDPLAPLRPALAAGRRASPRQGGLRSLEVVCRGTGQSCLIGTVREQTDICDGGHMFAPHCPSCERRVLLGTRPHREARVATTRGHQVTLRCRCGDRRPVDRAAPPSAAAALPALELGGRGARRRRRCPRPCRRWPSPAPGRSASSSKALWRLDSELRFTSHFVMRDGLRRGRRRGGRRARRPSAASSAAGTTRLAMPQRSQSAADRSSPRNISSLARCGPTMRGSR